MITIYYSKGHKYTAISSTYQQCLMVIGKAKVSTSMRLNPFSRRMKLIFGRRPIPTSLQKMVILARLWGAPSTLGGSRGQKPRLWGVVLYDPEGTSVSLSFMFKLPCSNNLAEYEALDVQLISALQLWIRRLRVKKDCKLVIQLINREISLKESALASYRATVQRLDKLFSRIQFEHVPRSHNRLANAPTTLASKVDIRDKVGVKVIRKICEPLWSISFLLSLSMERIDRNQ